MNVANNDVHWENGEGGQKSNSTFKCAIEGMKEISFVVSDV